MKHLKNFNINESNGLTYCEDCSFLLYPDDGDTKCKYCIVLDILGIDKNNDDDNVYGQLKYMIKFDKGEKLSQYLKDLKTKYNLKDEQYNKIIDTMWHQNKF